MDTGAASVPANNHRGAMENQEVAQVPVEELTDLELSQVGGGATPTGIGRATVST